MSHSDLPRVFCAIDTPDLAKAQDLAAAMSGAGAGLKLGLEFFNALGPQGVQAITEKNPDVALFLDLKFHDIPNTVAGAVRAVTRLAPAYLNVHASGGLEMMRAAQDAAQEEAVRLGIDAPHILGVTILTALDDAALKEIGYENAAEAQVVKLACLTQKSGLAGIVCSAKEIGPVRAACGDDFVLMVPGIRPAGAAQDDQKRVMTPQEALSAGASHLVIGRPITKAADPAQAAYDIIASL